MDWKINTEFTDSVMKLDHKKVLGVAMAKEILQSQGKSLFQVGFSEWERGRNIFCPFLCVGSWTFGKVTLESFDLQKTRKDIATWNNITAYRFLFINVWWYHVQCICSLIFKIARSIKENGLGERAIIHMYLYKTNNKLSLIMVKMPTFIIVSLLLWRIRSYFSAAFSIPIKVNKP